MPTNLALDDALIREAQLVGGHETKKGAVTAALEEYVQRRKQLEIFEVAGTVDYFDDYDIKASRRSSLSRNHAARS